MMASASCNMSDLTAAARFEEFSEEAVLTASLHPFGRATRPLTDGAWKVDHEDRPPVPQLELRL